MAYDPNIFYYIKLLKKQWKVIVIATSISMILAMLFSFLMPPKYVSHVTLLLSSGGSNTDSRIGKILGVDFTTSPRDVVVAILASKRMAEDIKTQFKYDDEPFRWKLDTYPIVGGLGVEIEGPDPALTEKIANFCIENLNKLNKELVLTVNPQMVKVLDSAGYGTPRGRNTLSNMLMAGILSFLISAFHVILLDYLKRLKKAAS